MKLAVLILLITFLGGVVIFLVIKNLLYICQPNEVLIFAGRHQKIDESRTVGYRLVKGGRSIRIPLIERVYRMDLTNMVIPLSIRDAYSKGGIPLNIDAVANVKISGDEPIIFNAIERLLGYSREDIMLIAKETLEGNLRGVLATLTPEEVNEDKTAFQQRLIEEAEQDLQRLGLVLDTLNIQNISDDRGYLDSLGRKQAAEVRKKALIAEAKAKAAAEIERYENWKEIELAKIKAEEETAKAEAERRIIDATSRRDAVIAEEKAKIVSEIARAKAEIEVQKARIEQTRRKLEADLIAPAKAQMESSIAEARGKAASIIEEGRATAEAFLSIAEAWSKAGAQAAQIFILQKFDQLLDRSLQTIQNLKIDQLTILPTSPDGETDSSPRTGQNLATNLLLFSEQLKSTLGIDLPALLKRETKKTPDTPKSSNN